MDGFLGEKVSGWVEKERAWGDEGKNQEGMKKLILIYH